MNNATNTTVMTQLLFVVLLAIASMTSGALYPIIYALSFIVPIALGAILAKGTGAKLKDPFKIKKRDVTLLLPTVFPILLVIILVALLTSFLLSLIGKTNEVALYDTLFENLLFHALLPAIFEELIFRYIPLITIARHSKKWAVIISAATFAASHMNLFQIPYALIAGVLFMLIDIKAESVIPSVLLHLLNNSLSVLSLVYGIDVAIIISVAVTAAISGIFIFKNKSYYLGFAKDIFGEKCNEKITYSPLLLIIPCLIISVISLI